ncbi:unnamed protein product [Rotaria socialis]|uniref:Alpha-1,2-mannosidase n=1 Tax=Rotaria socialis TaxID=392032 RepID=A0A818ULB8_9BILA|nr:unnamed protein product [Rotaria socialis]
MAESWCVLLLLVSRVATSGFPPLAMYIGTGGDAFGAVSLPVGAQSPYGAVRIGADTSNTYDIPIIYNHFGGYHYADTYINVFSHTHMVGAGVVDYGEVGIFPVQVDSVENLQKMIANRHGYRSAFTHDRERIEPGYYQVYLDTHKINVELTATEQVGVHRYSFDNFDKRHRTILIDSSYTLATDACRGSQVNIDPTKNEIVADQQQITVYVGISFISIDQARINQQAQAKLQPFDSVRELVQQKWLNEISRFEVSASWNPDAEIMFYTAVIHSMMSPTIWDESNGVYLGFDNQTHTKPDYMDHVYTDLSIWDVFRTQIPFIVFHDPKRANDIIHSIMINVEQGGDLPKWPFANGYTDSMFGTHACILLSDLIMKREHDVHLNITQVLEALRKVANTAQAHDSRFNPPTYIKYQYVPFEKERFSAPYTQSYAYDDWAIGNVMTAAGLFDEAQQYYNRSLCSGDFFCPSSDAERLIPFDYRYVEGDAWHYRFFAPHNTPRLIDLFGDPKSFVQELDTFFTRGREWTTTKLPNPYYWPGNEHDLFSVWQFHYANRSDLTQEHARWLLDHAYTTKPDGIPGNDDYGTMSAWYIFSSMGFYPLAGSSTYLTGSPVFDRITIRRNNGQCTLNITVHNNSNQNIYVEQALLNDKVLATFPFIDHVNDLQCSNKSTTVQLEFFMSSTPSLI